MADMSVVAGGPSFTAFSLSMIIIPSILVLLRLIVRGIGKELKWDDWLLLVALIFSIVQNALYVHVESLGIGQHAESVKTMSEIVEALKSLWISDFFANAALTTARCSVLFLYSRALGNDGKVIRGTIWTLQAMNAIWWIWSIIASCLLCSPISRLWELSSGGSCRNIAAFDLAVTIPSIAIDMTLVLFPVVLLDHLPHKFWVTLTLILALAAPTSSLGRLVTSIVNRPNLALDFTYYEKFELFWAAAETPAIIIASSLPAIFAYCSQTARLLRSKRSDPESLPPDTNNALRNNSTVSFSKAQVSPNKFLRSPISKPKLHPLYSNEEWPREGGLRDEEARDQHTPLERPSGRSSPRRKRRSFRILSLYLGNEASFGEQMRNDLNLQSSRRASTTGSKSPGGGGGGGQSAVNQESQASEGLAHSDNKAES